MNSRELILVMWSAREKCIIIVELSVPWEEGCEEAAERKTSKYASLPGKAMQGLRYNILCMAEFIKILIFHSKVYLNHIPLVNVLSSYHSLKV